MLRRRKKHRPELLEALGVHLQGQGISHVALTGDLGNIGLEREWAVALAWIGRYCGNLGTAPAAPADGTTVIPGNHDAYMADVVRDRTFEKMFAGFMGAPPADPEKTPTHTDAWPRREYPFVRRLGPVTLIGVNSCVPTGDLHAWGEVGAFQLERLEGVLADPDLAGTRRVILIHHPPVRHRGHENHNLRDRNDFCAVLARSGADLVLHGHDHRDEMAWINAPTGDIPVVGAGSASYAGGPDRGARYNVYELDEKPFRLTTFAYHAEEGFKVWKQALLQR